MSTKGVRARTSVDRTADGGGGAAPFTCVNAESSHYHTTILPYYPILPYYHTTILPYYPILPNYRLIIFIWLSCNRGGSDNGNCRRCLDHQLRHAGSPETPYYHTTILPYYHTTILPYYPILPYYHTTRLPYYHTTILPHTTKLPSHYFHLAVLQQR